MKFQILIIDDDELLVYSIKRVLEEDLDLSRFCTQRQRRSDIV